MSRSKHNLAFRQFCIVATTMLAACTAQQAPPNAEPTDQGIVHVVDALDRLGAMRFPLERPGSVVPAELERPVAFRWDGLLDPAVTALGERVGYRVIIQNAAGNPPTIVRIDRPDTTAIDLFRELAAACSGSAELVLEPRHHLVRVIHHA